MRNRGLRALTDFAETVMCQMVRLPGAEGLNQEDMLNFAKTAGIVVTMMIGFVELWWP